VLEISQLNTFYGSIHCLWDVSLSIKEAETVALIGANGAGKSTLLNAVSGIIPTASGTITFQNQRIERSSSHKIVDMGLAQVPEGGRPLLEMSVRENLEMGAYAYRAWRNRADTVKEIFHLFPRLKERENQLARTLSGGEKQMLAMGRGLMSRPKLCMFDEPSYGLAPIVVLEVFQIIKSLRERGITVLLVEQNVKRSLEIADRAYVMENGRISLEGPSSELLNNEHVKEAYLGR
jgi:branched-chain amino acid transport system ATP-binding protein